MFGIGIPEVILLSFFIIPGIVGAVIAGNKGRSRLGWFVLCACIPLLILIPIFISPLKEVKGKYKQCPACKEFVKWDATICKHCRTSI